MLRVHNSDSFEPSPKQKFYGRSFRRVITLLMISSVAAMAANPIRFHNHRQDYPLTLNQSAVAMASADLNEDGLGDVLGVTSGGVAVLLSEKGSTNYSGPVVYPAGKGPVSIAVGDFNGDGHVDVVTANSNGDDITILFGSGNGTLGAPVHMSAGAGPVAVVAADFNGDGNLDIAVADFNSNQVSILFGNGDGTFQPPAMFAAGSQPASLSLGDFNNDGKLDIAAVSQTGTITVLLGNGAGGFTVTAGSPSGAAYTYSNTVADFNGDGILDIAVAEYTPNPSGSIYVCLGKGDGTFQAPTQIGLPQYAPAVTSGDLTGNGHPDLIAVLSNQTSESINALAVLANDGKGNFAAPQLDGSPETPVSIAAVDLNRDGKLDVIVGSIPDVYSGQAYMSVVFGAGDGSLTEVREIPTDGTPEAVAAGDVNGDGKVDVVVANAANIIVYLSDGRGAFKAQTPIPVDGGLSNVAIADVNGDGKPDIVALVGGTDVAVLLGRGDGTFSKPKIYRGLLSIGFAVGDVNGDGYADVILGGVFTNGLQILWGSSTGALTPGPFLGTSGSVATENQAIAIGDFNGDGKTDIAVSTIDYNNLISSIELFPGVGNGNFGNEVVSPVPVNGVIAAGDMNGDGLPDLVLSGLNDDSLQNSTGVLLSTGNGSFKVGNFYASPYLTGAIAVADFNHDGKLDAVVLPLGQQLDMFTGDGQGNLVQGPIYGAGAGASQNLITGQFVKDGRPDLAFPNPNAGTFSIVYNTAPLVAASSPSQNLAK
jgi:hypothetical protein